MKFSAKHIIFIIEKDYTVFITTIRRINNNNKILYSPRRNDNCTENRRAQYLCFSLRIRTQKQKKTNRTYKQMFTDR